MIIEKEISKMSKVYDVAIIGSGPAALTAAIYVARENRSVLVIEKSVVGGLMATIDKIDNYPGFSGISGADLADSFWDQAKAFGAEMKFAEAVKCCKNDNVVKITTDNGEIKAKTMIICGGNGYRKLNIPGDEIVHYCATCDGPYYKNKKLIVIGGGNSAAQESVFLAEFASEIHLVSRHALTANQVLQDDLRKRKKIKLDIGKSPQEITVRGDQKTLKLSDGSEITADGIFVFAGIVPSSDWLKDSGVKLDQAGYILTDEKLMSNQAGIFAAGDIRSGNVKQIAVAVGEGATVANSVRKYLEKEE
jgi:thioredoxin reductase (NADPH)